MYWLGSESHNIFRMSVRIFFRRPKWSIEKSIERSSISKHASYWKGSESHSIYTQKLHCFTHTDKSTYKNPS